MPRTMPAIITWKNLYERLKGEAEKRGVIVPRAKDAEEANNIIVQDCEGKQSQVYHQVKINDGRRNPAQSRSGRCRHGC